MFLIRAAQNALLVAISVTALCLVGCPPSPPSEVSVPNCVGMTQSAAESAITSAGLTVGTVTEPYSDTVPAGQVMGQNPAAGASVAEGSLVALVVSKGEGISAAFGATPSSGFAPLQVQFEDESLVSTGWITAWAWDFGNPDSGPANASDLENPTHTYSDPGRYTVTLSVTSEEGSDEATRVDYIVVGADEEEIPLDEGEVAGWTAPSEAVANADVATADDVTDTSATQVRHVGGTHEYRAIADMASEDAAVARTTVRASDPSFVAVFRYFGTVYIFNEMIGGDANTYLSISACSVPGSYITPLGAFEVRTAASDARFGVHTIGPVDQQFIDLLEAEMPAVINGIDDIPILDFNQLAAMARNAATGGQKDLLEDFVRLCEETCTDLVGRVMPTLSLLAQLANPLGLMPGPVTHAQELYANLAGAVVALEEFHVTFGQAGSGDVTTMPITELAAEYATLLHTESTQATIADVAGQFVAGFAVTESGQAYTPVDGFAQDVWGTGEDIADYLLSAIGNLDLDAEFFFYTVGLEETGLFLRVGSEWVKLHVSELLSLLDVLDVYGEVLPGIDAAQLRQALEAVLPQASWTWRLGARIAQDVFTEFCEIYPGSFPPELEREESALVWDARFLAGLTQRPEIHIAYRPDPDWGYTVEWTPQQSIAFATYPQYNLHVQASAKVFAVSAVMNIETAPVPETYGAIALKIDGGVVVADVGFGLELRFAVDLGVLEENGMNQEEWEHELQAALAAAVQSIETEVPGAAILDGGATLEISDEQMVQALEVFVSHVADHFLTLAPDLAEAVRFSIKVFLHGDLGLSLFENRVQLNLEPAVQISWDLLDAYTVLSTLNETPSNVFGRVSQFASYQNWFQDFGEASVEKRIRITQTLLQDLLTAYVEVVGQGAHTILDELAGSLEVSAGLNVSPEAGVNLGLGASMNGGVTAALSANLEAIIFREREKWCSRASLQQCDLVCDIVDVLDTPATPRISLGGTLHGQFNAEVQLVPEYVNLLFGLGAAGKVFSLDLTFNEEQIMAGIFVDLLGSTRSAACGEEISLCYTLLTGIGVSPERLEWDLDGDGVLDTTTEAPPTTGRFTHSYHGPGQYTVGVTAVATDGASGTAYWPVYVCQSGEGEAITLPGCVQLEMVWIPGGTFLMGRNPGEQDSFYLEDPQHRVTLSSGFWMGKYEVTKRQWQAVMWSSPWAGRTYVIDDLDSPAVYLDWNDARAFVTQLNSYTGLTFRLPSEAEWEYACRAGTTTRFYWGDDANYTDIDAYAWWWGNTWDADERYAHLVGLKLPNAWGLHDMSGNAWEWCEDQWHKDYSGAPADGSPWVDSPWSKHRVLRSGRWSDEGGYHCRSASRTCYYPSLAGSSFGFRVAR